MYRSEMEVGYWLYKFRKLWGGDLSVESVLIRELG